MAGKRVIAGKDPNSFVFMLFALISGIIGQYFIYIKHDTVTGLFFLIFGVIVFIYADRKNTGEIKPEKLDLKLEIMLFSAVLLLAIFFRLYRINEIPAGLHDDEALNGLDALGIIEGKLPLYTHNTSMFIYFIAVVFKVLGIGGTQIRMTSAIFGILTVPALYFFIRSVFGARLALAGAFLLAVMRWHVNFSRIGYHSVLAVFVFVLVFYFAYRVYKEGKWFDFIALGLTTGLSQYTYQAARLIPVWLFLFCVYIFFKDRVFFKNKIKKTAVAAIVAAVVFLPMGIFMVTNQAEFTGRQNKVSIFDKTTFDTWFHGKTLAQAMTQNVTDTLLMFNYRGDWDARHNIPFQPELDFFTGVFAFLGFGWAISRLFKPVPFFLVSMFFIFLLPGFFTAEAPQSLRVIMVIPAVILFAVIFMQRFFMSIKEAGNSKILKGVFAALFGVSFIFITANNFNLYFEKQAKNPSCWLDFTTDAYNVAEYYKALGNNWRAISSFQAYSLNTFNFTYAKQIGNYYDWFNMQDSIPIKPDGRLNYVYLFNPEYRPLVEAVLKVLYPGGKFVPFYNKYSTQSMYSFAYEVPYSEIEKLAAKKYVNGLIMRRFKTQDWTGKPDWTRTVPVGLLEVSFGAFSCDWNGRIKIDRDGMYAFTTDSYGSSAINVDNKKIFVNNGTAKGAKPPDAVIRLGKGFHTLNILYTQDRMFGKMELHWTPPGGVNALVPCNVLYP